MVSVWTDGNGFGYYAYVTEARRGTIGRIDPVSRNRGRNAMVAEAYAILTALESVPSPCLSINTDSQAVLNLIAHPRLLQRRKNQHVRAIVEAIIRHLASRAVKIEHVTGGDNRAHLLLVPYRSAARAYPYRSNGIIPVSPTSQFGFLPI